MKQKQLFDYWYQLEYFSPAWPVDMKKDIDLAKTGAPWGRAKRDPQYRIFYDVYLGRASCQEMIEQLIQKLGLETEDAIEKEPACTCVCAVKLDEDGNYVPGSFAVSTFVWALCTMLAAHDFHAPLEYQELEKFQLWAETLLLQEGQVDSTSALASVLERVMKKLGMDPALLMRPCYWARQKKYRVKKDGAEPLVDPATELFGSFYLKDIDYVRRACTPRLTHFACGLEETAERVEIDTDAAALRQCLAPERFPMGKWPSKYSPTLMQQAAINLAVESKDLFSVNGPPGTGKTTLLKEVVAANVVSRAALLAGYARPEEAFTQISFTDPPDEFSQLYYEPAAALTDFGILVASNNNGAVENLSRELPRPIADSRTGLFAPGEDEDLYFTALAAALTGGPAWGLISARLGRQRNIRDFKEAVFWNKSCNLGGYYEQEKPSWAQARRDFAEAYEAVSAYRGRIVAAQQALEQHAPVERAYQKAMDAVHTQQAAYDRVLAEKTEAEAAAAEAGKLLEAQEETAAALKSALSTRKKLFKFLFAQDPEMEKLNEARRASQTLAITLAERKEHVAALSVRAGELARELASLKQAAREAENAWRACMDTQEEDRRLFGANYADGAFWKDIARNESSQQACPWTNAAYDQLRERLFYQALRLHRAFLLNCEPARKNLNRLQDLWNNKFTQRDKAAAHGALLNTLFLLVPVLSTTFASAQTFLDGIGPEQLGLLVIDEAGQAAPQAALGALLRTRRAVIVGDPLQVEPILTIPRELVKRFADEFEIAGSYRIPALSVQNLADHLNCYGGYRKCGGEPLWLGCPLVIHRRCVEPMFSVANEIAYNGRMFCQSAQPGRDVPLLFARSAWIDVQGPENGGKDHTVQAQIDHVQTLLLDGVRQRGLPDIFIITPFQSVARSLRVQLAKALEKALPQMERQDLQDWLEARCGTVHTFQGKEAAEVILVLGCDGQQGRQAAAWVGRKPNIVNVAATRAKYRLAVVGDRTLWSKVRYVDTLYQALRDWEPKS